MRCDAGRGCVIDCPGACVARWDQDLNLCETACLGPAANIKPITLGHRFSLSLHGGNGPQVRKLFDRYLTRELASALDTLDERIDLDMKSATIAELLAELDQLARGTPLAT